MMTSLREALGGGPPVGVRQVTLFIPSVDRAGEPIDQAYWTEEALRLLGSLFRGATAFPPSRGVWRDDRRGGALLFEDTQMVLSYVAEGLLEDASALSQLRVFLQRMGREASQGEVGVVIDGTYFGIVDYGEEGSDGS